MNIKKIFHLGILTFVLSAAATGLRAEEEINISAVVNPGNMPPIWVSLSGFSGEADSILRFDLYVQGFNFTNADNALYLITGSNNGNLQGRVTTRANKNNPLVSKGYTGGSVV